MKFEAVYHRNSDQYSYPLNEVELILNLKTGKDVTKAFLLYGDPFDDGIRDGDWNWKREELIYKKNLTYHIWWTTTVKPNYKRCKYYFELCTRDETYFYFEDGFYTEKEMQQQGKNLGCFIFPWMNAIDINKPPKWVNETVWYQIFPERFCNGDTTNDPEGTKPWEHHQVSNEEFYGGDLQGIIDKLDYLEDLGVNGIYLTPIFESETSHKYDTKDYRKIDPHFGDQKTLIELVKTAHAKGIRVMLDGVFNHSGHLWQPWQDVLEKGPDSKYYEWFMINKWPLEKQERSTKNGDFYSFAFTSRMPKLNTNHPEVIAYLLETVNYWMDTFGVDGLRLDVANEISHQFCKELRKLVKRRNPEFFLLGEIWNDSIQWLRGDEFDSVMNYPLSNAIADFWIYQDRTSFDFECAINQSFTMYMQQTNDVLFNLLDSHDTNRLMNKVGDLDVFYQQLAVLFTMPGSPCIYYGTEIAMEGGQDPDCRRCMPWDSIQQGVYQERIEILKQLIRCRKEYDSFRSAHFHFESNAKESRQIHFIKTDNQGGQIEVILNCTLNESLVEQTGTVLFSRKYENGVMLPKGILIRKLD